MVSNNNTREGKSMAGKKAEKVVIKTRIQEIPLGGTLAYFDGQEVRTVKGYIWRDGEGGVHLRKCRSNYHERITYTWNVLGFWVERLSGGYVLEKNDNGEIVSVWQDFDHSHLEIA
jgi:hypothetical protein